MENFPTGTLVYDLFGNTFIVKGSVVVSGVQYYYVEDSSNFYFNSPNPQCTVYGLDLLGRQITLPMPDCECRGILRLMAGDHLTRKPKPTMDNAFLYNRDM
jgi:hypothetical protein